MPFDRTQIRAGMKLTGDALPAEDPRRANIKKGMFIASAPARQRLPAEFREFEAAAAVADRLGAEERIALARQRNEVAVNEIVRRLQVVRAGLGEVVIRAKRK